MSYDHTQKAPLHYIFYPFIVALVVLAWIGRDRPQILLLALSVAATLLLVAMMFQRMTVRDEGEHLAVRYGPLPVFRKLIRYRDISSVERSRSAVVDGWGIHWIPGRGCTYNLWGFDCAKLIVRGRVIRIGTDDVENLVAFLQQKIGAPPASDPLDASSEERKTTF